MKLKFKSYDEYKNSIIYQTMPSVTRILEQAGYIDKRYYNIVACERGVYVHEQVDLINREGQCNLSQLFGEWSNYILAYQNFQRDCNFQILESEPFYFSEKYNFLGRIDIIGKINGKDCIVDIKTGAKAKWHGIQLAAYSLLIGKPNIRRYGLYLKKNIKYSLVPFEDNKDFADFLKALEDYK